MKRKPKKPLPAPEWLVYYDLPNDGPRHGQFFWSEVEAAWFALERDGELLHRPVKVGE
jgi:hypothetical protein